MLFKEARLTHLTHPADHNRPCLSCAENGGDDGGDGVSLLIYPHAIYMFVNSWLVPECTVSQEELDRIWIEWRATGVVRVPFRWAGGKVEREGLSA